MILLSFDFHYIDNPEKYPNGGIYPISVKNFSKQLDVVAEHFKFISQHELLEAIDNKLKLPEKSCLLTFDDGLRCQFENALPVLLKKKIPAIFFINTMPLSESRVCLVHKIHWLRSFLPRDVFLSELKKALNPHKIELDFSKPFFKEAQAKYRYDDKQDAALKFLLNNLIDDKIKQEVIDSIFKKYVKSEKDFAASFYINEGQIKKISKLGFVGGHSYNHQTMKNSSYEEVFENFSKNKKNLENLVGDKIYSVSYPYGSKYDINDNVISACKNNGFKIGFTKERAFNTSLKKPLLFARLDTNDVIGGKKPMFVMDGYNSIKITNKQLSPNRKTFFIE